LAVKAVVVFYSVGKEKVLDAKRLLVAQHRIQDSQEFPHTGGERDLLKFAAFQHLLVLSLDFEAGSFKAAFSRPTHQRVTPAVRRLT
jgi:hypothetical protein